MVFHEFSKKSCEFSRRVEKRRLVYIKMVQTYYKKYEKWESKTSKMEPKTFQNGRQMGYPMGPWAVKTAQKSKNNIDPTKKREHFTRPPLLSQKSGQHGSKLASKIEQKSIGKQCKNRMHLGIEFWEDFN